nr:della protein rgl1 [Quercus suber]
MAPPLCLNQFYNNESYEVVSAHNMCLSARACYPYQYLPISDNSDSTLDLPFPEETRDRKKLKRSISIADSMDSYSSRRSHASALLSQLRACALFFGSSFQRVPSCFVKGLAERLCLVQPLGGGLAHGHQWRALINSLANRADQPPCRLQITSVGLAVDRFQTIGVELMTLAESMGINFEFSVVESNLENLQPEDNKLFDGEVLVVNSILQLHCVVKESRGALNSVLQIIHKLSAKVLVLVEQESSHNGPFFLGRFMEALHYYSAIFDSLDTT